MVLGSAWSGRLPVTEYNQEGSNPFGTAKIMGVYQSGQLGLTVTQLSFDFGGSNPPAPTLLLFIISSLIYEGKKNDPVLGWNTVIVVTGIL